MATFHQLSVGLNSQIFITYHFRRIRSIDAERIRVKTWFIMHRLMGLKPFGWIQRRHSVSKRRTSFSISHQGWLRMSILVVSLASRCTILVHNCVIASHHPSSFLTDKARTLARVSTLDGAVHWILYSKILFSIGIILLFTCILWVSISSSQN